MLIKRQVFTPIPTEQKLVVSYTLFTTGRNRNIPVFLKVFDGFVLFNNKKKIFSASSVFDYAKETRVHS